MNKKQELKREIRLFLQRIGLYKKYTVWPQVTKSRKKYFLKNVKI